MKQLLTIFSLLLALTCCTTEADRDMDALLDRADSMNRAYIPMTDGIDSLLLEACRYYDRHGDANQQMRAHYLLGCAYRDMGEAPAALQSYQAAVDRADTLSSDCDYHRLMSVYGQMAELFDAQNLPKDELAQKQMYGKYALLIGDTLLYIRNLELYVKPYFLLGDTLGMLKVLQQAHDLYLSHGFAREASGVYSPVIDYYISKGQLDEARKLMKEFEEQSGLFDAEGNIVPSREIYYYIQGSYYLKRNDLPNAERCFRKLPVNYLKDAYKGLLSVFRLKGDLDSVAKYAYLYETALDTLHNQMRTDVVHQMSSMYNYTRHQAIAHQEQKKANQRTIIIWICVATIIFICVITYIVIRRLSHKRYEIEQQYIHNLEQLEQTQSEVLQLRAHADEYEELLAMKEKILNDQSAKLQKQRNKSLQDHSEIDKKLYESPICQKLLANQHIQKLTIQELRDCRRLVLENLPVFNDLLMSKKYAINEKDFNVCVLFRLGFKSKEVSNMLDISPGRVSQITSKLLREVFQKDEGGAMDLIEILHGLY